jgi:regulation of enolase protein 1 (concanavalin A-like superfamily)
MYYNGTDGAVQYPFGYGLSYTTFSFSNLHIDRTRLDANDTFHVSANITNSGDVAGREVAQLYIGEPDAPAALQRPIKRLEGFQLVSLNPGQTTRVTFTIKVPELAFFSQNAGRWSVDDGRYSIQVGSSSADSDIQLQGDVNVSGALTPQLNVLSAKPVMQGDPAQGIQERVMFPEHTTVLPQLTASMSDDTLYGYIKAGSSKPFPRGMRFAFRGDHPNVVSVAPDGTITTGVNGVATITATATFRGVSKTTSFVVRVLSELSGIKVNSAPLLGFHPGTLGYDVIAPDRGDTPRLSATTPDRRATISITQPTAVPGTGTIAITGPDDVTTTYTIYFARRARSDQFNSSDVGPQWTWIRQDPANEQVSNGSLTITPEPGDLTGTTNTARNILVQPALGNWTIQTKLTLSSPPHTTTQQAGIIAYQDDDNYLKLDWEFSSGAARLSETTEDSLSGVPVNQVLTTIPTTGLVNADTVWLRMVKDGPRYTTYYSTDGLNFVQLYNVGASLSDVNVGLFAFNGAGTSTDLTATFDYFHVSNRIPRS